MLQSLSLRCILNAKLPYPILLNEKSPSPIFVSRSAISLLFLTLSFLNIQPRQSLHNFHCLEAYSNHSLE